MMVGIFWHFCLFVADSVAAVDLIWNWAQSNCSCCSMVGLPVSDIVGIHALGLERVRLSDQERTQDLKKGGGV